jgi:DNA-directed RNA polymerase subunit D
MKVSNFKKKGSSITFVLEGVKPAFANALRRIMLAEVPTLAVEDITFFDNTSILYDEVVAHRIGLIPLKADMKSFTLPENCKCKGKGCALCQVSFTMVKEGPAMVHSRDLVSSAKKVQVADGDIPIVKLVEGQKIKLEAVATLGKGVEHAKWQPGVITYSYYPEIKISKDCPKAVKECPRDVFELKGGKVKVKDLEACSLCMACVEACGEDSISVKGRDDKFIFRVESDGGMEPKDIVIEAANILEAKSKELEKLLK